MKNVNFVPKYVQRILSSHKILEKYNEQILWNFCYFSVVRSKNFSFIRLWAKYKLFLKTQKIDKNLSADLGPKNGPLFAK